VYIFLSFKKGQKGVFKYMKVATDSGGTDTEHKGDQLTKGFKSRINNEHIQGQRVAAPYKIQIYRVE